MQHDQETSPQQLLLTIEQTAKALSLSRAMVYLLLQRGEFRAIHIGRAVRISWSDLCRWVQEREKAQQSEQAKNTGKE